jgi:hypothetical protein
LKPLVPGRVIVRLVMLCGAAAALALVVRHSIADRLVVRVDGATRFAAESSRLLIPRASSPAVVTAPKPFVPMAAASAIDPVPIVTGKPRSKPATANHAVTKSELEHAVETRLSGASARLVRDASGKPLGLRLDGVARLAPFGVHDGDVLLSANGLPLRSADEALAALGALKDARHVVVVLQREATRYSVPIDLVE